MNVDRPIKRRDISQKTIWLALPCLVFVSLAVCFIRSASPTTDETVHLAAGYSYDKWDDYRINLEHPPLIKQWAA
ncbi:MAG TPA: hypothetical protein VGM62_10540, partial [Chthoniobacterales bacterium]